jgi:hypothetical protein
LIDHDTRGPAFTKRKKKGGGGPGSRPSGGGRALISIYLAGEDKSTKKNVPANTESTI